MAKSIKLYDLDAYQCEFEGQVIACKQMGDLYEIELDQTLFFPEEGGQSPDKGSLNGVEICDVQIKGDQIFHYAKEPLQAGSSVKGVIDWTHRFSNMQQHSGEHIFSGTVNRLYGFNNVGFHLSDQIVTMDFDGPLGPKEVEKVESLVNQAIVENLPIEVSFPSKEELETLVYRSKIEIEGQVRIVTIPGVDTCACCAPHVRRTGEIGMLKVMSTQSYKGGVRISILCGFRALEAARTNAGILAGLTEELTTSPDKLVESVRKLKNQTLALNNKLMSAKEALLDVQLEKLDANQPSVLLFEGELEDAVIRNGVNKLVKEHTGLCGIFSGSEESGYKYIIGSSQIDCKEVANELRTKINVRGGGSPAMIQGFATASKESILQALQGYINA